MKTVTKYIDLTEFGVDLTKVAFANWESAPLKISQVAHAPINTFCKFEHFGSYLAVDIPEAYQEGMLEIAVRIQDPVNRYSAAWGTASFVLWV